MRRRRSSPSANPGRDELAAAAEVGYGDISADWYGKPDPFYYAPAALVSPEKARAGVGGLPRPISPT